MKKNYLYEIDLMRTFIMLGVLSVHTMTLFMYRFPDLSAAFLTLGALHTSLHFTRESFMFITGLVLFATYYRKDFHPLKFWTKRLLLIAVPYVAWNLLYLLYVNGTEPSFQWSWTAVLQQFGTSLATGDQFYLYYILVSIQLYLVFPFLLWGLRKTEKWHVWILIGSFLLQLVLMYDNKYPFLATNHLPHVLQVINQYRDRFILTYQFWFIAGGIMMCHYEKIKQFVDRHVKKVYLVLLAGIVLVWAHYLFDRLVLQESDTLGEMVLQPIMIPYSAIVTLVLWQAGRKWAQHRTEKSWQPFSRFVGLASSTSFGIYLFQPFPLALVRSFLSHVQMPTWLYLGTIPFAILFVYFSGIVFTHYIGKIPYVAYCVGRSVKLTQRVRQAIRPQQVS